MPHYILKFETELGDRYLMYSTIVDAPITNGMTREEFRAWYIDEYGEAQSDELEVRLKRLEEWGTSESENRSASSTILYNRAGWGETRLTINQFIDFYVTGRVTEWPTGTTWS